MRKLSEAELNRKALAKVIRAQARLEASIRADAVINDRLPDALEDYDCKLAAGEIIEIDVAALPEKS